MRVSRIVPARGYPQGTPSVSRSSRGANRNELPIVIVCPADLRFHGFVAVVLSHAIGREMRASGQFDKQL